MSLDRLGLLTCGPGPRSSAGRTRPWHLPWSPVGSRPHSSCVATADGAADPQTRTLRKTGINYLAMSHLPLIIDCVHALPHLISLNPVTKASTSRRAGGKASSRVLGPGSARPQRLRGGAPSPSLSDGHRATHTPACGVCSEQRGTLWRLIAHRPMGYRTPLPGPGSDLVQFCMCQRHGPK